ncbi:MAG TPA: hypothetical protein VNW92_12360 [Polyangiaceae bacterium]|jgi:hypothetical protein|nr:hypothetical protein [Polyangiaceae bacterium]
MRARRLTSARRSKATGAALCLLLSSLSLLGCERKAPGPEECQRFAETAVGMARDDERVTLRIQAEIDEETQTCLTRPYDRALIACVESTRRARPCLELYKRRTGQIR